MTAADRAGAWIKDHVIPGNLSGPPLDTISPAPRWLELPDDPPDLRRELRRLALGGQQRRNDAPYMKPPAPDLADLLTLEHQQAALPAGAASPASLHDPAGQLNDHDESVSP